MADPFRDMFEVYRLVVTVCVTEDGVYWKDEVPDELAASYIELEYPVRLILSDVGGAQHYIRFAAPKATNKDKKTGCTIKFNDETLSVVTGEVNVEVTAERVLSTEFSSGEMACAKQVHNFNVTEKLQL